MAIEVTLLGTGNPVPSPDRAGAATLVRAGGLTLLVDAGRGVLMRLASAGVFPGMLSAVLLTHLHSDHITDLNDVVTMRWAMSPGPNPLRILGPGRTGEVVDGMMAMLGPDIEYRIAHHDDLGAPPELQVTEITPPGPEPVVVLEEAGVRVLAAPTDHRPVEPTIAFRVEHEGSSAVLGGDGVPCAGLDALCLGADVYVQTVLREDLVAQVPMQRFQDTIDYHSSVAQAADTARRAGVGTLVLTHQVPGPAPGSDDEWRELAANGFAGDIVVGSDLTKVVV